MRQDEVGQSEERVWPCVFGLAALVSGVLAVACTPGAASGSGWVAPLWLIAFLCAVGAALGAGVGVRR
ncbi:MAG: hypothetical protein JOZ41_11990 [Chloroflexi bacterium]|nr:hypothetical protein [Chloroflexota bacterium]